MIIIFIKEWRFHYYNCMCFNTGLIILAVNHDPQYTIPSSPAKIIMYKCPLRLGVFIVQHNLTIQLLQPHPGVREGKCILSAHEVVCNLYCD